MTRLVLVVLLLVLLSGCETGPPPPPMNSVDSQNIDLNGISSICDQHGNRVYVSHSVGSIAVVGQDPTCKEPPR